MNFMFDLSLLRRNIFYPIWTFKDRSRQLHYYRHYKNLQWESKSRLETLQLTHLKNLLIHAYDNTTYYRRVFDQAGFNPYSLETHEDIRGVPVLTKADIRDNLDEIISKDFEKNQLIKFQTGGSTGKSLTVYCDINALDHGLGAAYNCFNWTGWQIGDYVGRIWGNPPLPESLKERLKHILLQPSIYLDTVNLNESSMLEFVREWRRKKPSLLHGHAHSIFMFSSFLKSKSMTIPRPKGIVSTSMMLLENERELIEEVFGMKIFDLYGCEEVGLIACECEEHNGLHINAFNNYVEFLDEKHQPLQPGEPANIHITNLWNYGMPTIRYKIEDMGTILPDQCACGRGLPLMKSPSGRLADFLIREDGSLVQGISLIERTLTKITCIHQMQVIQDDINRFTVNLVIAKDISENYETQLSGEFKQIFGKNAQVLFNLMDRIEQEPSGKYRFSICNINRTNNSL